MGVIITSLMKSTPYSSLLLNISTPFEGTEIQNTKASFMRR